MSGSILDGRDISNQIKAELAISVKEMLDAGQRAPHLGAILVGEDPASQAYVGSKVKACEKVGFKSTLLRLPANTTEEELLSEVEKMNKDDLLDGFIVQLPLPKGIDETKVIEAVLPEKDVDGFHPINVGKLALGLDGFVSATPKGIIELIRRSGVVVTGKHCVILGRSNIVGGPMAMLLRQNTEPGNCTVTICHSRTKGLDDHTKRADILIAAIGQPEFVKAEMVKEGAIVIDVGINRVDDASRERGYKLVGDVDYEKVAPKSSYITPVPGGVGPMTIAALLMNTLKARETNMNQF